jgi:hypothetical protein
MEVIRALGMYQPYASLMLHGKIETRWVRRFKCPPFPLGKYLLYSTKKDVSIGAIQNISGPNLTEKIYSTLDGEKTAGLFGYALLIADLAEIRVMTKGDEEKAFALFKSDQDTCYKQWCLVFQNVQRIKPFPWSYGKQGIGIIGQGKIPASEKLKIIPA